MAHILCASFLHELCDRLLTFLLFVHCQHLIARNMRELFSSNCGVKHLRKQFAQQVARHVDLRAYVSQLNPTDLLAEFERIDTGVKGGTSGGFISREELWEFVSSGKAEEMSERDFNLVFDSMDIKGRGKVNFVEFCAFMSSCGEVIQELAKEEKAGGNRDEKLNTASRRILMRKLEVDQEDELSV